MSKFSDRLNQARKDESIRSVAKRAAADDSVGESTLHPYFRDGHGRPTAQVVKALAKALGIATDELWILADMPSDGGPWSPPDESRFMNDRQRQAVAELIRSFVQTQGAAHDVETAPESDAQGEAPSHEKNPDELADEGESASARLGAAVEVGRPKLQVEDVSEDA